jgi:hypothetical protein
VAIAALVASATAGALDGAVAAPEALVHDAQVFGQAVAAGREEAGNAALRRLTTPANAVARIAAAKAARAHDRVLTLGAGPAAAPGTVNLLLDRQGRVVAAHLVSGDASLRAAVARSVGKTLPFPAPDERLDRSSCRDRHRRRSNMTRDRGTPLARYDHPISEQSMTNDIWLSFEQLFGRHFRGRQVRWPRH